MKVEESPPRQRGITAIRKHNHVFNGLEEWRESSAIEKHFHEFQNIGTEKEVIFPTLDFQCLTTLIHDCDVPQVCKSVYLGEVFSQYMLMHQVMYQEIAERVRSCASVNSEAFAHSREYQDRLCSKAFLEAQYLESHDFPTRFIDLFAEQVGFCGAMGYPNFLRGDWLQQVLSWKSGSISGCMPDLYGAKKTTDATIKAQLQAEDGSEVEEDCLVHLTSVSLMALAMNLRYMFEECQPTIFKDFIVEKL